MALLAVVNPSRRRRRRKSAKRARRGHRKMTALQLKYFGKRRHHKARRRRAAPTMLANPRRRRSHRKPSAHRRHFRRNPISSGAMRANLGTVQRALTGAAVGAGGAIAVDIAMAQAAKFLPAAMTSRFDAAGAVNYSYYGAKAAIAIGLGILGAKFLPGRLRSIAARGAEGSLTVQGYELVKGMLPAAVVLGYMNPGRITTLSRNKIGAYLRRPGVGAYLPAETRVGEGVVS
ncbi:MAG: hypothetical protein ACREDH_12235 [Methylocella sp.]